MISAISNKRRRRNDSLCGFTLIELVLVALIILILLGLSSPLFRRTFSDLTLKDTAYNISNLINYGQEMAIIERKNFKMSFNFEKGRYWLSKIKIDNPTEPPTYERVTGKFGRTFTLPQGISFSSSMTEVILYPDGHSDEAIIDVFSAKGGRYRISVKGFGRRIDVKEIKSEE